MTEAPLPVKLPPVVDQVTPALLALATVAVNVWVADGLRVTGPVGLRLMVTGAEFEEEAGDTPITAEADTAGEPVLAVTVWLPLAVLAVVTYSTELPLPLMVPTALLPLATLVAVTR